MELQSEQIDDQISHVYKVYSADDARPGTLMKITDLVTKQPALVYASKEGESGRIFNLGYDEFHIGSEEFLRTTYRDGLSIRDAKQEAYAMITADMLQAKTNLGIKRGKGDSMVLQANNDLLLRHGDVICFPKPLNLELTFIYLGSPGFWASR